MAAVQIKDTTSSDKDPMSVIACLKHFESTYNLYRVVEIAEMWLLARLSAALAEAAIEIRLSLQNSINIGQEGALQTYCEAIQFSFKTSIYVLQHS